MPGIQVLRMKCELIPLALNGLLGAARLKSSPHHKQFFYGTMRSISWAGQPLLEHRTAAIHTGHNGMFLQTCTPSP